VEEACFEAAMHKRKITAITSRIEIVDFSKTASGQVTMTVQATCQRGFLPLRVQNACRSRGYVDGIKPQGPLKKYLVPYARVGGQLVPTESGKAPAQALHECTEPDAQ
jgi:hypothetical protein